MSELHENVRDAVAALSTADPARKRFGAAAHQYTLSPPLAPAELAAIEERTGALPDDYREHLTACSAGGAGPYYGLLPAMRASAHLLATHGSRALPLAHLGCGYLAVLLLDGPDAGQIWLDARHIDLVMRIAPSFTAFVVDWIDRLAHNRWLESFVPPGKCALQAALGGYMHMCEEQLGLAEGTLAGAQLQEALAGLGPGSIAIAAEGPLWRERETVDPCILCARVIENLAADGLDRAVVVPGLPPIPARS